MSLLANYTQDLLRSQMSPLLMELTCKDIQAFSAEKEDSNHLLSFLAAQSVYETTAKAGYTNILSLEGGKDEGFMLLNTLLDALSPLFKELQTKEIGKNIAGAVLSFVGGGALLCVNYMNKNRI